MAFFFTVEMDVMISVDPFTKFYGKSFQIFSSFGTSHISRFDHFQEIET